MILLISSYLSTIFHTICAQLFTSFLRKKPLGMQTLFDQSLILTANYHTLFVWHFVLLCTLGTFSKPWPEECAKIEAHLFVLNVLNNQFYMIWVCFIRYSSINWPTIFDNVPDYKIMRFAQLTSLTWAVICSGLDFAFYSDIECTIWFNGFTGKSIENAQIPRSSVYVGSLMVLSFACLQIYIEYERYQENGHFLRYLCSKSEDNGGKGYSVHFYRVIFVILLGLVLHMYFPYIKAQDEFVPLMSLTQLLACNVLMLAVLISKGDKMKHHVVSYIAFLK